MMSYLHPKFHDNWISSFRGVAMTRFWDRRTDGQADGVTRLLDLISPLATQVKILTIFFCRSLSLSELSNCSNSSVEVHKRISNSSFFPIPLSLQHFPYFNQKLYSITCLWNPNFQRINKRKLQAYQILEMGYMYLIQFK